ncbi:MAG TPA: 50S ribosomal protein L3 [Polyangiaceae bacterium]|jgi:large subunit ribosomal protein L3|nr:50S ribosomal protein L3 [Polyangiaceae bacterium]
MNQYPGLIGRKLGMTQIFAEDGSVIPCTVVESNAIVVGKRTQAKDGYDALVLGLGERKEKHTNKALAGAFKKANVTPRRTLRELRCSGEFAAGFEVGAELKVDQFFEEGQFVDVQGVSRGRGFSGVVRRYHFAGGVQTHGTHEYRRHGGSIGTNMTPGRVKLGMKMPGQHGNKTVSVLGQKVVKVLADQNLILIRGGIPGSRNGLVVVHGAIKRRGGKPSAK